MLTPKGLKYIVAIMGALAASTVALVVYLFRDAKAQHETSSEVGVPAVKPAISFEPRTIGDPVKGHPMITHLIMTDLDQDGLMDVVACDGETDSIRWLRQFPKGVFTETQIGDSVKGPAHVAVCDINGDGKPDLLVASMGIITPTNDKIGSVVVLENLGGGKFRNRTLIDSIARVTDVRGVDVNGDGKIDLVIGQFGYVEGEIRWMENLGNWQFKSHILLSQPGTIHTPIADFNGDGHVSFAALVSQDSEEVHLFSGNGQGEFRDLVLWKSSNTAWGSSGLEVCDLNRDGRPDLVYTNGDGFDSQVNLPAWHGLQWLENRPDHTFIYHRIGDFPGCYSPVCADLDGDGNIDIIAVSAFNNWHDAKAVSMMAWMNDGHQHFTPVPLAYTPTHLIAIAVGDLSGDGIPEIVTGGFYTYPPWTEMSRFTLWKRR